MREPCCNVLSPIIFLASPFQRIERLSTSSTGPTSTSELLQLCSYPVTPYSWKRPGGFFSGNGFYSSGLAGIFRPFPGCPFSNCFLKTIRLPSACPVIQRCNDWNLCRFWPPLGVIVTFCNIFLIWLLLVIRKRIPLSLLQRFRCFVCAIIGVRSRFRPQLDQ